PGGLVDDAARNKTVATYDTVGTAYDVTIINDIAFIADGANGVVVLNVANPAAPTLLATYDTPGDARQLEASGNFLYVADTASLRIYNIANPAVESLVANHTFTSTNVRSLSVDDPYVYVVGVGSPSSEVYVVNVTTPSSPVTVATAGSLTADGITVTGQYVYLVDGTTFTVLNKYPLMTMAGSTTVAGGDMDSVQVTGSYAYINDFLLGLDVVNVTNPAAPTVVVPTRYTQSGGHGGGSTVSNGYVFLTQFTGNLAVYDITQAGSPVFVDSFQSPANGYDVTIANSNAYVASGTAGLHIIDVEKPDIVPPVITPVGSTIITITPGQAYTDPGVSAIDGVDGDLTSTITVSTNLDTSTVGQYYYRITVTDRAGNTTTLERTLIVNATVSTITVRNGAYTATFNGRRRTLRPFGRAYTGAIFGRRMIVRKYNQPVYVFVQSRAAAKPTMALYDYKGNLLKRLGLSTLSTVGLKADAIADGVNAFLALAPTSTNARIVRTYKVNATSIQGLNSLSMPTRGTIFIKFIRPYSTVGRKTALATAIKGRPSTKRVWRYSTSIKKFTRDAKYPMGNIVLSRSGVSLKSGVALLP
ncbi:MAG: DUF5011 domain-containing protein, partial [Candidatus Kerfeldbacteria bacterium]|nr:DUF5011 domain-containing protein [Candidatus Kerfeldbacteria bacterium]